MGTEYFIPQAMANLENWILWKLETREGKSTKTPFKSDGSGYAKSNDPSTWSSLEKAHSGLTDKFNGVGFVFAAQNDIVFIDLDHCIDENGELSRFARNVTEAFEGTFMEISQSGTGIHIFAKGTIPKSLKKPEVEMYNDKRFVAFTGRSLNMCEITDKQELIDKLYFKYADKQAKHFSKPYYPPSMGEDEIIQKIMTSKQAQKFWGYYYGNAEANSENTLGLASILAFWTGNDHEMIKSIMYKSKLVRNKFDRKTGDSTWIDYVIGKAIDGTREVYSPKNPKEYEPIVIQKEALMELDIKSSNAKLYYSFSEFGYERNAKDRILTGLPTLDVRIKGLEMGCVTIWTSPTNGGKTTMMTLLVKESIKQGEKVFMFNGEQTRDDFKNNLYKQSVDKNQIYGVPFKNTPITDYYVNDAALDELERTYGNNVLMYDNECKRDMGTLLYAMQEVHDLYGIRMFILDNLMQIEVEGTNLNQEQTELVEKLRTFAINTKSHVNLVAHPRKGQENLFRVTLFDISGTMNIPNKAFNVCGLIRIDQLDSEGSEYKRLSKHMRIHGYRIDECDSAIEILKTKGEGCGIIGLKYDKHLKTYFEANNHGKIKKEDLKRIDLDCPWD